MNKEKDEHWTLMEIQINLLDFMEVQTKTNKNDIKIQT